MLTIKVAHGNNVNGLPYYSVYEAKNYTVDLVKDGEAHIYLDNDQSHLMVAWPNKAFVMNDKGSTVDTIWPTSPNKPAPRHHDKCNVWVGCQQCDGPDLDRECTCGLTKGNLVK